MVTNRTLSFFGFSYACGDIQWSGQGFETAIVGYNSHADYFFNHPANGIPDIGRIVSCIRQVAPTKRRRKRQLAGTDEPAYGPVPTNPELRAFYEECVGLAMVDQASIPDANNLMDVQGRSTFEVLPACPPTRDLVQLSPLFVPLNDASRDCFQSTIDFVPVNPNSTMRPYRFVSVCCYDDNRYNNDDDNRYNV